MKLPRQYFALTQVCQLLRQEYRSLYIADMNVNVWLPDLLDFVTTFLDGSIEQLRHYKGILTVHIPALYPYWTDLTPLLSYLLQAPDSNIEFICGAMIDECTKAFINIFNNTRHHSKPHRGARCLPISSRSVACTFKSLWSPRTNWSTRSRLDLCLESLVGGSGWMGAGCGALGSTYRRGLRRAWSRRLRWTYCWRGA
jgi:hypothetical protein